MVLHIKKDTLRRCYMVAFVFTMIFAPPFLPEIQYLLSLYAISVVLLKYRRRMSEIFQIGRLFEWTFAIFILTTYAAIMIAINSFFLDDLVQSSQYLMLFVRFWGLTIVMVTCSAYLLCYMSRYRYTWKDLIDWIMKAGIVQSVFAAAAYTIPAVRDFFFFFLIRFSGSDLYTKDWFTSTRAYGFSTSMVDQFGFGMGIIAGIALFYGIIYEKAYIVYSLIILLAGLINARTTIIMYAISIAISIFYFIITNQKEKVFRWIKSVLMIALGCFLGYIFISKWSIETWEWIVSGIEGVLSVVQGADTQTDFASRLFAERSWNMPEGIQLFFGSGHSIYGANGYEHSDVGYTNDIWFIGIFGVLVLYGYIGYLFYRCYNISTNIFPKLILFFLPVSALAFNIKGAALGYSPGTAVIFSILFVFTYMFRIERKNL